MPWGKKSAIASDVERFVDRRLARFPVEQAGREMLGGRAMDVVPLDAVAAPGDGGQLGGEYDVVDRLLFGRESAAGGKCSSDVGRVAGDFAAGVDEHYVVASDDRVVPESSAKWRPADRRRRSIP